MIDFVSHRNRFCRSLHHQPTYPDSKKAIRSLLIEIRKLYLNATSIPTVLTHQEKGPACKQARDWPLHCTKSGVMCWYYRTSYQYSYRCLSEMTKLSEEKVKHVIAEIRQLLITELNKNDCSVD